MEFLSFDTDFLKSVHPSESFETIDNVCNDNEIEKKPSVPRR